MAIHNCCQIRPDTLQLYVGHIRYPNLITAAGVPKIEELILASVHKTPEAWHATGYQGDTRPEFRTPHQASDALSGDQNTAITLCCMDSRVAISALTEVEYLSNRLGQLMV